MTAENDAHEPGASAGRAVDLRRSVADVARSLRAWVEWHDACGTIGLPTAALSPVAAAESPAPRAPFEAPRGAPRTDAARAREAAPPPRGLDANAGAPRLEPAMTESELRTPAELAVARHEPAPMDPILFTAEAPLDESERRKRLAIIAEKAGACRACVLCEKRTQAVVARGNPMAEVCFVGEGPGEDEDRLGEPFVGKAGQLLDRMIGAMGLGRDDVYICNVVKCRPPNNRNPMPAEMSACMPFLVEQLDIVKPKVMVTLGNIPLKALFGVEGITKQRGSWRVYKGSIPVMPTYHPAYVLRNPTAQVRGEVWKDLREVLKQMGKPIPKRSGEGGE